RSMFREKSVRGAVRSLLIVLLREEAVVVEIAIDAAGDLGRYRTGDQMIATQEHDGHDAPVLGVRVRGEPAKACAVLRARTRLAEYLLFTEVGTQAARGAV